MEIQQLLPVYVCPKGLQNDSEALHHSPAASSGSTYCALSPPHLVYWVPPTLLAPIFFSVHFPDLRSANKLYFRSWSVTHSPLIVLRYLLKNDYAKWKEISSCFLEIILDNLHRGENIIEAHYFDIRLNRLHRFGQVRERKKTEFPKGYYIWILEQQDWEVDQEIDGKMRWERMEE